LKVAREEVLKAAILVAMGLETRRVKVSGHFNKKLNRYDNIRVSIPISWAEELGLEPGSEIILIKDPETKTIIIAKPETLEELKNRKDLLST